MYADMLAQMCRLLFLIAEREEKGRHRTSTKVIPVVSSSGVNAY